MSVSSTEPRRADSAHLGAETVRNAPLRRLACTECRRRKQKCNYRSPCNNCSSRFPQPVCTYPTPKSGKKKGSGHSPASNDAPGDVPIESGALDAALSDGAYSHLNLDGIREAILQIETTLDDQFSPSTSDSDGAIQPRPLSWNSDSSDGDPQESTRLQRTASHYSSHSTSGRQMSVGAMTRLALRFAGTHSPGKRANTAFVSFYSALLCQPLGLGDNIGAAPGAKPLWNFDMGAMMRSAYQSTALDGVGVMLANRGSYSPLPVELNDEEKELMRIYLQLLCRFKVSIDGFPDPENPWMRHWIPLCLSDPLLIEIMVYTSSCYLSDWGRMPFSSVLAYKHRVYRRLSAQLRSPETQISDAAILAVDHVVIDAWLWGNMEDLLAHVQGLKTMIRMRGGFQKLGMQGYLAKNIISSDIALALAHEVEPFLYGHPGFGFEDPFLSPLQPKFNSPFLFHAPSFLATNSSLRMHPSTAHILEEIRLLLQTMLSLPDEPVLDQIELVRAAALVTAHQLAQMPEDIPAAGDEDEVEILSDGESPSPTEVKRSQSVREPTTDSRPSHPTSLEEVSLTQMKLDYSWVQAGGISNATDPPPEPPHPVTVASLPPTKQESDVDLVYRSVRMTAFVYCRAIISWSPTSEVCSTREFLYIWDSIFRASLAEWTKIIGVFVWAMVGLVPSCHEDPRVHWIEVLLKSGMLLTSVENWHVSIEAADAAVRFQRLLRTGLKPAYSTKAQKKGKGKKGAPTATEE